MTMPRSFVLLLSAVVMACAASAPGQSAKDYFEPLVNHQQFALLVHDLELSREQRMIVELVFTDYRDSIDALAEQADRAADEVGRRRVLDAMSGRIILDTSELRRLRLAVLDVYETYLDKVDAAFEELTLSIESVLVDEQQSKIKASLRELRRAALLHPRHGERTFQEYAGDGVDVLLLHEEATKPGGELATLDPGTVSGILEQYEHNLDRLLIETSHAYRLSRMSLRKARVSRDARDLAKAEKQVIEQWRRLYELNERTVAAIGEVVAAGLGEHASMRWNERFQRACFDWMFSRQGPDRQHEWMMSQSSLTAEQRELAQDVYEEFLDQRQVLAGQAIALMIRARLELESIIHSMMDPTDLGGQKRRIYDELLRNSGEMATLDAATTDAFENILDRDQRRSFRNVFRRR